MENINLIIDFMGYKTWKPWIAKFKWFDHTIVTTPYGHYEIKELDHLFKNNWDWLKDVIDKIGKIPFSKVDGMREYMSINWSDSKVNIYTPIDDMYEKVIDFIKWYNDSE